MGRVIGVTSASPKIKGAVEEMRKNFKLGLGLIRVVEVSESSMPDSSKKTIKWHEINASSCLVNKNGRRKGSNLSLDEWIDCLDEILLKILEKLGFSLDETCTSHNTIGTLYYAVILRKIILFLEATKDDEDAKAKKEALREALLNNNSQFYLDIAGDYVLSGGISRLHELIEFSLEAMSSDKKKQFSDGKYMRAALTIAELLLAEIRSGNIKVEEREVNTGRLIRQLKQKEVSLC